MVKSTQIARIDGIFCIYELLSTQLTAAPGLMLAASVDDEQVGTPDFPREYSFGVLFVRTIAEIWMPYSQMPSSQNLNKMRKWWYGGWTAIPNPKPV